MSGDEAEWHCKQLPNGANPIVVCERAVLLAEVERLRAEVERLRAAGDALIEALDSTWWTHDIWPAVEAWQEARRG